MTLERSPRELKNMRRAIVYNRLSELEDVATRRAEDQFYLGELTRADLAEFLEDDEWDEWWALWSYIDGEKNWYQIRRYVEGGF